MSVALERLSKLNSTSESNRFSHYVYTVSEEADVLLRKALYEYVSAIKNILLNDKGPKNQIRVLNIQDIFLNDPAYLGSHPEPEHEV